MWINASTIEGERARDDASQLFLRGCARKRRSPGEIISMEKRIRNSIKTEEQEAYRDGVPIPVQHLEEQFILELQEHFKRVIWRTAWKVSTSSSSCTRTKRSGRTAMSSASCAPSDETDTTGQLYSSNAFFSSTLL